MKRRLYACTTIQKELLIAAAQTGFTDEICFLDERLHSEPRKMHEVLQGHIDANTDAEELLICVSGCGKSTLGLKAATAAVVLPRTMDCIDILLSESGVSRPQGAIFMTKSWMGFTKRSRICHEKLLREQGPVKAAELLRSIYRGFTDFYIIDTGTYAVQEVEQYIRPLVEILQGELHYLPGRYEVLYKMLSGNYDKELIYIPRGGQVDISEFNGLHPAVIK